MLSFVLLLLLISGAQASYYGVVYSYSVGDFQLGAYQETEDWRMSFSSCEEFVSWFCGGDCSPNPVYLIDESRGEWCQKVFIGIGSLPLTSHSYVTSPPNWIENRNGIVSSTFELHLDRRKRSDINKPGSSPRTNIIPLVRVPSNCQRNINLLVSDPDGDDIRCRYAVYPECIICTPPSVLSLSSSCSLSFSPTNSSNEGPYVVQMMVEDFPRQNITLTEDGGGWEVTTTSDAMNRIPIQFVFTVDPAAPSCTEGEYLPRFLPPTPEHGAQFSTNDSETLEIIVRAEATQAETTEILISGPAGVTKSSSGSGNFTLTWTPVASDRGLNKTLCFVVQANSSGSVYQSDLRCVLVTAVSHPSTTTPPLTTTNQPTTTTPLASSIQNSTPVPGPNYVLALNTKISTSLSLETDSATITNLIKEELIRRGLSPDITLKLLSSGAVQVTTAAP
ncbi:uncharacterized protein LOC111610788 [Xiphophorus maculatus]|uniref:uncharacterized protein LOC111610788 n=1 Tax=Xiphophorus maculatus TaxID=8083 RepID=UPI000C6C95AC|nr:uncharacterized protein LOC111610788 [Xiphophorus maculatus]